MLSTGALIWMSVRPIIRTFIIIGTGFALTKADLFPIEAARGAAQLALNIVMPCLLFSRIVPSFSSDNMDAIGPLMLIGFLYGVIGALMAWSIKRVLWVPHRFRYGILVAGAWGNVGDIPIAIAQGITSNAPFNGTIDENLATAYIAVFILVFLITLFPLGGHLLVAKDFDGPDVESDVLVEKMRAQRKALLGGPFSCFQKLLRCRRPIRERDAEQLPTVSSEKVANHDDELSAQAGPVLVSESPLQIASATTRQFPVNGPASIGVFPSAPASERGIPSGVTSATPTLHGDDDHYNVASRNHSVRFQEIEFVAISVRTSLTPAQKLWRYFNNFTSELLKPTPLSVLIALPIALIEPLKALFVAPSGSFQPSFHPTAPDGYPPLAFILDTATFTGNASVPLGLVCLGSALARLNVGGRENWARMPRGAIAALAVGKMLISPVVGVVMVIGLVHRGLLSADDKVLQFVCIILAGLPAATTQVYLTQVYNPTGSAEHVAAFLIPQYMIMFVSMTALCVYSLNYLFPS